MWWTDERRAKEFLHEIDGRAWSGGNRWQCQSGWQGLALPCYRSERLYRYRDVRYLAGKLQPAGSYDPRIRA
ncbi:hypothetical protein D3C78_1829560 [compost metagenome]